MSSLFLKVDQERCINHHEKKFYMSFQGVFAAIRQYHNAVDPLGSQICQSKEFGQAKPFTQRATKARGYRWIIWEESMDAIRVHRGCFLQVFPNRSSTGDVQYFPVFFLWGQGGGDISP